MEPCIVAGLGNPGTRYEGTRHNLGFRVIDSLSSRIRVRLAEHPGPVLAGRTSAGGIDLLLLKPLTYMNNSGRVIAEAAERNGVPPSRVLVAVDDFALPLGAIRIRPRGSDGGHNGLASVIEQMGTTEFPRLRMGIAGTQPPAGEEMAAFVLSLFAPEEEAQVDAMVARASEACLVFAGRGIADAMNSFNTVTPSTGPFATDS